MFALKLPEASLATIVEFVLVDAEFKPSSKSASRPDPEPSLLSCQILVQEPNVVPHTLLNQRLF